MINLSIIFCVIEIHWRFQAPEKDMDWEPSMINFQNLPKAETFYGGETAPTKVGCQIHIDSSGLVFQMARSCLTQTLQKFQQPILPRPLKCSQVLPVCDVLGYIVVLAT